MRARELARSSRAATTESCSSPRTSCRSAARLANLRCPPRACGPSAARPPRPRSARAWRSTRTPWKSSSRAVVARARAPAARSFRHARRDERRQHLARRAARAAAVSAGLARRLDEPVEQLHVARAAQRRRAGAARATSRRALELPRTGAPRSRLEILALAAAGAPAARRGRARRRARRRASSARRAGTRAQSASSSGRNVRRSLRSRRVPTRIWCSGSTSPSRVRGSFRMIRSHAARDRRPHRVGGRVARPDAVRRDDVGRRRRARSPSARTSFGTCSARLRRRPGQRRPRSARAPSRSTPRPSISISRKRSDDAALAGAPRRGRRRARRARSPSRAAQQPAPPPRAQPRHRRERRRAHEGAHQVARPPSGTVAARRRRSGARRGRPRCRRRPGASGSSPARSPSPVRWRSVTPWRASRRSGVS